MPMRRITRIASTMALMAGLAAAPALAQQQPGEIRTLSQSGDWSAAAAVSSRGVPMCVMSNLAQPTEFHLKYFRGARELIVHLYRNGRELPEGERVPVSIRIDGRDWNATATSFGRGLEITVGPDAIEGFTSALRGGETMQVTVADGSKARAVQYRLAGADRVSAAFADCVRNVSRQARTPDRSQPAPVAPGPRPREFTI
jgi:invasion protein IalB